MNHVIIHTDEDLVFLLKAQGLPLITRDKNKISEEIDANMWALTIGENDTQKVTLGGLKFFMCSLLEKQCKQLSAMGQEALFYVWHDQMAGQLRFNVISDAKNLPFDCNVEYLESIETLLQEFLDSEYHGGVIAWNDIVFLQDDNWDQDQESDEPFVLNVYALRIDHNGVCHKYMN